MILIRSAVLIHFCGLGLETRLTVSSVTVSTVSIVQRHVQSGLPTSFDCVMSFCTDSLITLIPLCQFTEPLDICALLFKTATITNPRYEVQPFRSTLIGSTANGGDSHLVKSADVRPRTPLIAPLSPCQSVRPSGCICHSQPEVFTRKTIRSERRRSRVSQFTLHRALRRGSFITLALSHLDE